MTRLCVSCIYVIYNHPHPPKNKPKLPELHFYTFIVGYILKFITIFTKHEKIMCKFTIEIFLHTFRCSFYFLASCQTVSVTRCAPWWTSWAGASASCSSQRWISQSLSLGQEWAWFVSLTPPGVRRLGLGMPLTFLRTCSCNGEPQLYLLQKKEHRIHIFGTSGVFLQSISSIFATMWLPMKRIV